ncbi:MAG TPA: hypothetical protein VF552_07535 [Allosphingosinicella sp.]|jgi:hypothetical protein
MSHALLLAAAARICRLAAAILPRPMRRWGAAMQHELPGITNGREALAFALGCFGCALRMAIAFHLTHDLPARPRAMVIACAAGATGLGLVHLVASGAPLRHAATNAAALLLAILAAAALQRPSRLSAGPLGILLALSLVATALLGTSVDGASRWIAVGGLFLQPSLLIVPALTIRFARTRDPLSAAGVALCALALALQPDRAMAGALTAALAALLLLRPERTVLLALGAAATAFASTLAKADLPDAPPLLLTAFSVHPLAGLAVFAGAALILLPAIAGRIHDAANREAYTIFGALWLAVIVASVLGNAPMPLVGYGGSAILGYVLSLLGLPRHAAAAPARGQESPSPSPVGEPHLKAALAPAR